MHAMKLIIISECFAGNLFCTKSASITSQSIRDPLAQVHLCLRFDN